MAASEKEFENRILHSSTHFIDDLNSLIREIEQKRNFHNSIAQHIGKINLAEKSQFKWFETQMQKLISWDKKILGKTKETVENINLITEILRNLSRFHKVWPFAVAVTREIQIFSSNRFKGDLKSVYNFFKDQHDTDVHALDKAKEGHNLLSKFWFKMGFYHHEAMYGFSPHAIHLISPRYQIRIKILKAIAEKRVHQLRNILAKEDNYERAKAAYNRLKSKKLI